MFAIASCRLKLYSKFQSSKSCHHDQKIRLCLIHSPDFSSFCYEKTSVSSVHLFIVKIKAKVSEKVITITRSSLPNLIDVIIKHMKDICGFVVLRVFYIHIFV